MPDTGAHRRMRALTHANAHGRGRGEGEKHALGVLRVSDPVIEQIPIKRVHPGVTRMTGGATVPILEANTRVVEIEFPPALRRHGRLGPQGDGE